MMKRRGLVSKSTLEPRSPHAPDRKRERSPSDDDSVLSSSDSSGFSSSSSDSDGDRPKSHEAAGPASEENPLSKEHAGDSSPRSGDESAKVGKSKGGKKKQKPDFTDETKWQKVKLKGSEKEVMIDKSRLQTYVDFDSAGVANFQNEVKQAQGNFRQQALADYSDL